MSENTIEFLDLSALDRIESIQVEFYLIRTEAPMAQKMFNSNHSNFLQQCCKNQIKELTLNGRVLNSLVASNNSKIKFLSSANCIRELRSVL